jgi:hypothetical protein
VTRREALGALAATLAPVAVLAGEGRPRIRVEPTSFDFGRVRPQRTLRKEFRLQNLGDGPLVIERISRSCGCTQASTEADTLAPGESTPLHIEVQTRASSGLSENTVLVRSNDPETPSLRVVLRATVVSEGAEE